MSDRPLVPSRAGADAHEEDGDSDDPAHALMVTHVRRGQHPHTLEPSNVGCAGA